MVDADLVAQALAGNANAFAAIYDRYADRIYDYASSVVRNDADAADVTQDTFLVGMQRLGQLRDPSKLRPWLYAIARSHGLRIIRNRRRVESSDDVDEVVEMTPADAALDAQQLVRQAAAGLEDGDRDLLDLHLRHGIDGQELADVLGVSANAANVALHRVRDRFEQSATAVLLASSSSGQCAELDQLVVGGLTPLVRKRVTRHVASCVICEERKKSVRPFSVFAGIPLLSAPSSLRESVLSTIGSGSAEQAAAQITWNSDGFATSAAVDLPTVDLPTGELATAELATVQAGELVVANSAGLASGWRLPRVAVVALAATLAALLIVMFLRGGGRAEVDVAAGGADPAAAAPVFAPTRTPAAAPAPGLIPVVDPTPTPMPAPTPTLDVVPSPTTVAAPPAAAPSPSPTSVPTTPTATVAPSPTTEPTPTSQPIPTPSATPTLPPAITPEPTSTPFLIGQFTQFTVVSFECADPMVVVVDVSPELVTGDFEWVVGETVEGVPLEATGTALRYTATLDHPTGSVLPRVSVTTGFGSRTTNLDMCAVFE